MSVGKQPKIECLDCDWFPASMPSDKLLIVLHGRGDSSQGFHWLPDAMKLPGLNYLMPNAPDDYYGGYSWYALPPDQEEGVIRSRKLFDKLFNELIEQGWNPSNIALFGFSQGCLMTLEWGLRSSIKLAAYVGISGYCLDPQKLLAEKNEMVNPSDWLITHGTQDEVLPFEVTRSQIQELQDGGLDLAFKSYRKSHTIDPYEEFPVLREFITNKLGLIVPS